MYMHMLCTRLRITVCLPTNWQDTKLEPFLVAILNLLCTQMAVVSILHYSFICCTQEFNIRMCVNKINSKTLEIWIDISISLMLSVILNLCGYTYLYRQVWRTSIAKIRGSIPKVKEKSNVYKSLKSMSCNTAELRVPKSLEEICTVLLIGSVVNCV